MESDAREEEKRKGKFDTTPCSTSTRAETVPTRRSESVGATSGVSGCARKRCAGHTGKCREL